MFSSNPQNKNKSRNRRQKQSSQLKLYKSVRSEIKCFDAQHQALSGWTETSDSSTKIVFLQSIAQGIAFNQRRGRKYRIIGSEFSAVFSPSNAEMYAQAFSVCLVQDKVTQGQSIVWGDIWTLSGTPTPIPQYDALRSMDYYENAKVIWKYNTHFADANAPGTNPSSSAGSIINIKNVKKKVKHNIVVHCTTGNTSSVADIQDNSLYLMFCCNVGTGVYKPVGYWTHRIYFVDE